MKESAIITAINHYLNYLENQGKLVFIRNNSGAFINPRGNFFKMGRPGSPDFFIFLKDGKSLHLEVKNEKGRQNIRQINYEMKITNLGHRYCIVRSVDEVERLINS
jgi:hypothetical protein